MRRAPTFTEHLQRNCSPPGSTGDDLILDDTESENPFIGMLTAGLQGALVYHGYKRNNSVGWALAWMLVPWPIGIPIALAQGFAKRRGRR